MISPVVAVTGLAMEARIGQGPEVITISGGGNSEQTAVNLQAAIAAGARGVISFGAAGGLAPHLAPGDCIVPEAVTDGMQHWPTDAAWSKALLAALPQAIRAPLAGVDRPVADAAGKRNLHESTGAAAVDMESHIAAPLAAARGLPFVAFRVIIDPAERSLPAAALVAMRPDGGLDIAAVMASLARQPSQIAQMIRLTLDTRAARSVLLRSRRMLGPRLGFPSLGVADLPEL
jgi:hopanoid-associated phosphorylase